MIGTIIVCFILAVGIMTINVKVSEFIDYHFDKFNKKRKENLDKYIQELDLMYSNIDKSFVFKLSNWFDELPARGLDLFAYNKTIRSFLENIEKGALPSDNYIILDFNGLKKINYQWLDDIFARLTSEQKQKLLIFSNFSTFKKVKKLLNK